MARTSNSSIGADPRSVRWIRLRVALLALTFVPLFGAVLYRAVNLQVIEGAKLADMAADQTVRHMTLPGRRGSVYDRRGVELAASVEVDSIWADPRRARGSQEGRQGPRQGTGRRLGPARGLVQRFQALRLGQAPGHRA
ncbi:MAG: hypothetical protein QM765_51635 [Myxococcales bacterium]